ncbi:MAG: DUF3572 domain-containing protein [Croceibacterium sp.]
MTIQDHDNDSPVDPSALALQALQWVLADAARARRFLDLTGLTPDSLRRALAEPATQRAVLEFLCAHEPDLIAAGEALGVEPQALASARERLT